MGMKLESDDHSQGFPALLGGKERYNQDKEFMDLMIKELDRANAIITEYLTLAK